MSRPAGRADPGAPLRVAVCGAAGRMGQRLLRLIASDPALVLGGAFDREGARLPDGAGAAALLTADPRRAVAGCGVLVDFSAPEATEAVCAAAEEAGVPALVGTTGLTAEAAARVEALSRVVPVVQAANTSLGVHALLRLVGEAVRLLGPEFDAEVVELHHRGKADAPSGTALALARAIVEAAEPGVRLEERAVTARQGRTGPRAAGTVGVQALRGGDAAGEHTVLLLGDGERLELTHRCTDRDVFARGALRAARWAAEPGRPPGLYGMADVLTSRS